MITSYKLRDILLDNFYKFEFKLSLSAKLTLLALAKCYNPKNKYVYPKQSTIGKKLGIGRTTIVKAIKELEKNSIISKIKKFTNLYEINIRLILELLQIDTNDVQKMNIECSKNEHPNITDKEYIKEQQVKKNFSSNDSPAVKKTKELIRSYKDSELKSDYQDLNREEAIIYLGKCVPRTMFKKSTIAKYLMDKFSITIDEIPKREELDGELGK